MKGIRFFLPLVFCSILVSCQKELDSNVLISGTGNNSGLSTNGDLIIKLDGRSGNDSNVTIYTYNSAKQLIATLNKMSANSGSSTYYGYERDAAGLIVRRKQYTTSGLIPIPADTSVTIYHYSTGATPQIVYSTSSVGAFGFSVDDSTVYTYNTAGKLTRTDEYQSSALTGTFPSMRQVFTYDAAGNVAKLELYTMQASVPVIQSTDVFTYDSKTAAETYTEAEAIAITNQPAALHNVTGLSITTTVGISISSSFTFNYNTSNRPATSQQVLKQSGVNTTTNFTFYYQQ